MHLSPKRPPFTRARGALAMFVVATLAMVAVPAHADTAHDRAQRQFTVATYNLYLGANLQPLFGKEGIPLIEEAAAVFAHVAQTDFPSRAVAIAKLIAEEEPLVVGLQEVSLWETAPADPFGNVIGPFETVYDFEEILIDALEAEGVRYRAAAENVTFSAALPIDFPITTVGGFTDRNVILVRDDLPASEVKVSSPTAQLFQARIPQMVGGQTIAITRGWASVDVKVRGKSFRVVDAHLESYSDVIRALQAQELVASLADSPIPVVLLGDLNDYPGTGSHAIMQAAGFTDGWTDAMGDAPGFTAGQTDEMNVVPSQIDHTVDYVMHRPDGYLDTVAGSGEIIGEEEEDMTPGGLWPSDHAGIVLTYRIASP